MKPRLFFIPDIHGRHDLLALLWARLHTEAKLDLRAGQDKVIFGGDYVDRGPDSKGVLTFVRNSVNSYPDQVVALAGNHEWLMIDGVAKRGDHLDLWLWNGGGATLDSYGGSPQIENPHLIEDVKWLAQLPLSHEEPGFFFSHAPLPLEKHRHRLNQGEPFTKKELIWTYDPSEGSAARDLGGGIIGVCGHVHGLPRSAFKPRFYPHYIFADAGCGCHRDAPLVAIDVMSREVFTTSEEGTDGV